MPLPSRQENAAITRAAKTDPDNPPLSKADMARLRSAHEVEPHLAEHPPRRRGRPPGYTKERVSIRLDKDVVEYFKAKAPKGWQTDINAALRRAAKIDKKRAS
ncbi:MAG: hypothetical protein D6782_08175 [Alphaproteobacteria bacterium]|nr:MAG: hypothetical protein D6782_08175 [Alphaproteobacteria bacterium]